MKAFVRYYVELPFAMSQVDEVVRDLPGPWLDAAAREANVRGLLMLGDPPTRPGPSASRLCMLMSTPEPGGGLVRRSVEWRDVCDVQGEPVLRGDLELAELGAARTQLALSAQYRPWVGATEPARRMVAQRVAESTVKAFVDQLAQYVQTILGAAPSRLQGPPIAWPAVQPKPPVGGHAGAAGRRA